MKNPFKELTGFEWVLWLGSLSLVTAAFLLSPSKDYMSLGASLIGATALIFVAKGFVIGQVLTVVFAVFYGIISFHFKYYGEMITYLGMTSPIAVLSAISWLKNPYGNTSEVKVNNMTGKQSAAMWGLAAAVTAVFYFILKALGNTNLLFSTVSVTTSFLASYLTFMRSQYYALAYAANDVVLIILWVMATVEDLSYAPMAVCFFMFLANDVYGFVNWRKMRLRQEDGR